MHIQMLIFVSETFMFYRKSVLAEEIIADFQFYCFGLACD